MLPVWPQPEHRYWRKSSYSLTNGECVEVATVYGRVAVRDSNDPGHLVVVFREADWRAFIEMIQDS